MMMVSPPAVLPQVIRTLTCLLGGFLSSPRTCNFEKNFAKNACGVFNLKNA